MSRALRSAIAAVLLLAAALPARAHEAQMVLHLLDYVGVDYAGAVEDGKVKSEDEYKEMREFAAQIGARIGALPENARKGALVGEAQALSVLIATKSPAPAVSAASARLRGDIVAAYGLRLAPRKAPDLARGKVLYGQACAGCHGAEGRGDGPAAKGLDPAPSDFHDAARMARRSLYGLYNTISLGVAGTSMAPFGRRSEDERWALAFYVGGLGVPRERVAEGERRWRDGEARAAFPDLANIATLSSDEVRERFGEAAARVQDYLRADPAALRPSPVAYACAQLAEAREAVARGALAEARDAATRAYLEGYELVEAPLANVDAELMRSIEREMLALRGAIERGEPAEAFAQRAARVDAMLESAAQKLDAGALSPAAAFTASLVILLREGLEAILLLAAILAFVRRAGAPAALKYVHAGWMLALAFGAATWAAASYLIRVSGANRELTEGATALVAVAMLLYVGYWLHGKSKAMAWSAYLRDNLGRALERRALWAMAGASFLAVYREIFEVILFYEALWGQAGADGHAAIWSGAAAAAVALAALSWAILRYSVRLPLGPFFGAMSLLLALLAVVFAGQGIAALQEAGVVSVTHVAFFTLPALGIHPTAQTLGAQILVAMLSALLTYAAGRAAAPPPRAVGPTIAQGENPR